MGALNNVGAPNVYNTYRCEKHCSSSSLSSFSVPARTATTGTRRSLCAPTITTARVTRGDLAETVGATGALQAVTTVQVGTQVSGTIQELNADFNSLVRKGQVLARLDPSLIQSQIEQARANLIRAEADLERLRVALDDSRTKLARAQELSAKKLIAQTELEAAEVTVRSSEAQLRSQEAGVTQSQASLQAKSGQPRAHRHRVSHRRPRHLAQRRRWSDRCGEHVGADAVRARGRPDENAGARQPRRI